MDSPPVERRRPPEDAGGTIPYDISTSNSTDEEEIKKEEQKEEQVKMEDINKKIEHIQKLFKQSESSRRVRRVQELAKILQQSESSLKIEQQYERLQELAKEMENLRSGAYIPQQILNILLSTDLVPSHDGRILVVGSYGVGKTTLVMNLIYEKIPKERQSTIGIDVYFGNLLFDVKNRRLLRRRAGQHSFSKALYQKLLAYLKTVDLIQEKDEPENNQWEITAATIESIHQKVNMFAQSEDAHNEEFIPIPILDFAGQIVYLATHQTFITSHGIYAVTFNGAKDLHSALKEDFSTVNENYTILDGIRQWVSSILTYCFKETKGYPKILFVATHRDLLEDVNIIFTKNTETDAIIEY